jgi:branched-chain amino acid transport system permease protein
VDVGTLTQQLVNALTLGAIYALIALGYTMVYGIIELINFAHGEIFMCGSFVSWWLLTTLGFSGAITDPLLLVSVLLLAFAVSMVVMGVVGVVIERLAYRRLRNAPRLAPLITAIGVSFILQNIVFVVVSNSIVTTPQIIPNTVLTFGFFSISLINLFVIILAVGLMATLQLFIGKTRLGRAMRHAGLALPALRPEPPAAGGSVPAPDWPLTRGPPAAGPGCRWAGRPGPGPVHRRRPPRSNGPGPRQS